MNIWLIRHGLTLPGEEGRYQGFLDESLSEKGKLQLREAPQKPSHVYTSPAKRARETASILFPARYREWVDGMCLGRCPGGESRASFSERVCNAFLDVLANEKELQQSGAPENDLFIVSHGGTQMAILERWGRPVRDYYSWQSPCGCGWLLALQENESANAHDGKTQCAWFIDPELWVIQTVSFVRKNTFEQ